MSGVSSNASSLLGQEKYVIWLGTYYFNLMPNSIANMTHEVFWKSEQFRPAYVDIFFQFQFARVSELDFNVTVFRYRGKSTKFDIPSGYALQFHCAINHFSNEEPRIFEMQAHEFVIMQRFSLDTSYQQFYSPADFYKPFELKICIKLIEYNWVESKECFLQNDHLYRLQDRYFNFTATLEDLAYIMRIPRFETIFTGRQDMTFAEAKSNYIKNAAHYSKEMADYLRALDTFQKVPDTDLGLILNFILHGRKEPITDAELFEGYIVGYIMGLAFVVELSRELIILKLPKNVGWANHRFLIDALTVADRVNDWVLFELAARKFEKWESELGNSEALFDMLKSKSSVVGRFMLYTLTRRWRRLTEAGYHLHAEVEGSSQSSPKEYITLV